jgi:[protein-PII] uridylyltransferase
MAHRFMYLLVADNGNGTALNPVADWQDEPDCGVSRVKVCTWDRAGLFSKIAGSFSAAELNIMSAQVFTRLDGIVVDTFSVTDAGSGRIATAEQRGKFEEVLRTALATTSFEFSGRMAPKKLRGLYQAYSGERLETVVHFENDGSDNRTLIEIETEDRVGLLYQISQVLAELSLDIVGAKICTERGAAIDSFYVQEKDGRKLTADRQRLVERKLRSAITALVAA